MSKLTLSLPLNSLSFGQVAVNIAREIYNNKIDAAIFPYADKVDLSAYDLDDGFIAWLNDGIKNRLTKINPNAPCLRLWHINGSNVRYAKRQILYTFHELDSATETELNLVKQQDFTFFSSNFSKDVFEESGLTENIGVCPVGFDPDILKSTGRKINGITHWVLIGKWESRKNTANIISTWVKKFGGNRQHFLTLCVENPFLNEKVMQHYYNTAFGEAGKPFNVNVLKRLEKNSEINQLYHSADIDLGGLARNEGWNLPSFNMTALGKWSIIANTAAHKDWANKDNALLVEPIGKEPCYDNVFFRRGEPFNQGNFYSFNSFQIEMAMDEIQKKLNQENTAGKKLQQEFSYKRTVDTLLSKTL